MSVDGLGYILALLTIGMSFVAVRYRNMLLTLGAATMWAVLLTFILANTTAGTNWQSMFILGATAFICAFALISFFTRSKGGSSFTDNIGKLSSREKDEKPPKAPRRTFEGYYQYRAELRSRLRQGRRR